MKFSADNQQQEKPVNHKPVAHISAASILIKSATLLIGQPFDAVKTNMQANIASGRTQGTWNMLYNTWQTEGVTGLYRGLASNLGQTVIKSGYRGPLMIKTPEYVDYYLPDQMKYAWLKNIISAGIIGAIDAGVICPWDWAKVRRITSDSSWNMRGEVMEKGITPVLAKCYATYSPLAMKEALAWGSFFMLDDYMKYALKQFNTDRAIPYYQLIMGSFVAAAIKVAITNPVDVAKTSLQKENPLQTKGIFNTMYYIAEQQGVNALMRGAFPRYIHGVLAIATGSILRHWWAKEQETMPKKLPAPQISYVEKIQDERKAQTSLNVSK